MPTGLCIPTRASRCSIWKCPTAMASKCWNGLGPSRDTPPCRSSPSAANATPDLTLYPYPSVTLLDLEMPNVDGFEVLEWLRTQPRHAALPVVALSGKRHARSDFVSLPERHAARFGNAQRRWLRSVGMA